MRAHAASDQIALRQRLKEVSAQLKFFLAVVPGPPGCHRISNCGSAKRVRCKNVKAAAAMSVACAKSATDMLHHRPLISVFSYNRPSKVR